MNELIYLDHNATTPTAPEVRAAMNEALASLWGNPSSAHAAGRAARAAVEEARDEVASLLGSRPGEVIFTSGGTESDNLAILGVARARREAGNRLVISAVEHPAVTAACEALAAEGFETVTVPVGPDGRVDPDAFIAALTPATAVASLMLANNETGALQPVARIAEAARARSIPFHCDAAQAVGKIPVTMADLGVDLLTLAGHKFYGPKGIGALIMREGTPLSPLLHGAPHEAGRRPGTENTPGIVGLGAAAALARREIHDRVAHAREVTALLLTHLRGHFPDLVIHGPEDVGARLPNTVNVGLPGIPAHEVVAKVEGVALSAGAACHAGTPEPSAVLIAMGVDARTALYSLRLSSGRGSTPAAMEEAAAAIAAAALKTGHRL